MSPKRIGIIGAALTAGMAISWWGFGRFTLAQEAAVRVEQQSQAVEVLTRGPVHEAFAEPVNLDSIEPLMIDQAPPEPVEELPPEQIPEGDNVQWIPGYWAWEDERSDFLWVSGVWRDVPPGQRWVPGYWTDSGRGWYWTSGFWISEQVAEVEYLPDPPESLEAGPQIEAPSSDHLWVPGIWRYRETRYVWQPGFWTVARPGWVWVPARYVWCPTGYIFVDGYWDYPLVRRGVLFAPVYYNEPVFVQPDYYYTPSVVIHAELLTTHLFARPSYCHYYFGDYYAPRYQEIGIVPWFSLQIGHVSYDPLFSYYSWYHGRRDPGWHRHVRQRYEFFATHDHYRPAHTYRELRRQRFRDVDVGDVNIQNIVVQQNNLALTLNQYVQNVEQDVQVRGRGEGLRFGRLPDDRRRDFAQGARNIRTIAEQRHDIESSALDPDTPGGRDRQVRRTLPIEQLAEQAERGDRARRTREGRFSRDGRAIAGEDSAERLTPTRRAPGRRGEEARDVAEATPDRPAPLDGESGDTAVRDQQRSRLRDRAQAGRDAEPDAEAPADDVARDLRGPLEAGRRGRIDVPGPRERDSARTLTGEQQPPSLSEGPELRGPTSEASIGDAGTDVAPGVRDPLRARERGDVELNRRLRDRDMPGAITGDEQRQRLRGRPDARGRLFEPGATRSQDELEQRTQDRLPPGRRSGSEELPGPGDARRGPLSRPDLSEQTESRLDELSRARGALQRERETQFRDRWDAGRRREGLDVPTRSDIQRDLRSSLNLPQRVEDPARGRPISPLDQPDSPIRAGRGQDRRGAAMSDAIQSAPRFRTPVDVGEPRLQPDPSARQFERSRGQFERPARPDLGVPSRTPTQPDRRQELRGRFESLRPQDTSPGADALMERLRGRSSAEALQRDRGRSAERLQQQLQQQPRFTAPREEPLRARSMPGFSPDRSADQRRQFGGARRGVERPDADARSQAVQRMGRGPERSEFRPEARSPLSDRGPRSEISRGGDDRGRGRPDRRRDRDDDD